MKYHESTESLLEEMNRFAGELIKRDNCIVPLDLNSIQARDLHQLLLRADAYEHDAGRVDEAIDDLIGYTGYNEWNVETGLNEPMATIRWTPAQIRNAIALSENSPSDVTWFDTMVNSLCDLDDLIALSPPDEQRLRSENPDHRKSAATIFASMVDW